ncbi:MAG: response regulator [Candidatus Wallbacteria bacterium]|nr:response regulator [Candidatus Wallbacteria bacterium]
MESRQKVLLVEDSEQLLAAIGRFLKDKGGYEVVCADCGKTAIDCLASHQFDIIVSDVFLGDVEPAEMLRQYITFGVRKILFMSGTAAEARSIIGNEYPLLCKPFLLDQLLEVMKVSI